MRRTTSHENIEAQEAHRRQQKEHSCEPHGSSVAASDLKDSRA